MGTTELTLSISPHGRLVVSEAETASGEATQSPPVARRIASAFEAGAAAGMLHLATVELAASLPPAFMFVRDLGRSYLTRLCQTPGLDAARTLDPLEPPATEELAFLVMQAPPMTGLEYLAADVLRRWWIELDDYVRTQIAAFPDGAAAYLRERNPLWRLVGRVTFHLAENKRDDAHPFAFMATYASRLSAQGRVQHLPLSRALQDYAGAKNRAALVSLLTPIQQAAERVGWVKELVESGGVYQPLAWTPRQAHALLQVIPELEESGLIVRVPDWWKPRNPPRPQVHVKIGDAARSSLGADALLDFKVGVAMEGQSLTEAELRDILASTGGLVRLRGQWVEVDREKLKEALDHWKQVERAARQEGISFFEGMRLLSGAAIGEQGAAATTESVREWTGIAAGQWLDQALAELRDPQAVASTVPAELKATLRPYQQAGLHWLRFMTRLGLGACLADDMGLGKTVQVLALLLHVREQRQHTTQCSTPRSTAFQAVTHRQDAGATLGDRQDAGATRSTGFQPIAPPCLLVVPASLIANWKSEMARFAPVLRAFVAHPSETEADLQKESALDAELMGMDLAITTYGMLSRLDALRRRRWNLVILDEAQAIKNSGARQTRAVKELSAAGRVALTGTPIENRLSDLWSLFDFLNPGLLGGAKAFSLFVRSLQKGDHADYTPLRTLVRPYILRRLKTDRKIIADLPDKTEVKAYCGLSEQQAAIYQQSVGELREALHKTEGIQRRGVVLAYLMRFKQICNHPSHWTGDGTYDPQHSGKFKRLSELCEELADRQEKALIFTQFREITAPLAEYLAGIFGRNGLVLTGSTPVKQRREMVEAFQRDEGPPFFVLSLKAGGTGLNLTAACHVIHFDRWWNPAVENQATDRAFRIGQKRNVMVHKFICLGTVEEKIDELIGGKVALSQDLLDEGGAERLLTEMNDQELLRFVSLDVGKAIGS